MINLATKKLIILDRDGVINYDSDNYIKSPEEWNALPGSLEAIKKLNDAGKLVAVATNQAGPARGLFSLDMLAKIHEKFFAQLAELGAHVDAIEFCTHHPDDKCACRKPQPGMLTNLLEKFSLSAVEALMIGDAERDLQAAHTIGMDAVLVKTGKGERTLEKHTITTPVYDDLAAAVRAILHE
jgi:D-glycero-D-manno-heptose 1,7-bisphosphate phosphatase